MAIIRLQDSKWQSAVKRAELLRETRSDTRIVWVSATAMSGRETASKELTNRVTGPGIRTWAITETLLARVPKKREIRAETNPQEYPDLPDQ